MIDLVGVAIEELLTKRLDAATRSALIPGAFDAGVSLRIPKFWIVERRYRRARDGRYDPVHGGAMRSRASDTARSMLTAVRTVVSARSRAAGFASSDRRGALATSLTSAST